MIDREAQEAVKNHILVGTSNVQAKGGFCLYLTGHLIKMVKVKGKKEKDFVFQDTFGEAEVIRSASAFSLAE